MTEWGGDIKDRYKIFKGSLQDRGFVYVNRGTFRETYVRKNLIIKVPRNHDGIVDNRVEDWAWHHYKSKPTNRGLYLAPCKLMANECLAMIRLDLAGFDCPKWVDFIWDGQQVGKHPRNKTILVYDYACDIYERYELEAKWNVTSEFFSGCPKLKKLKIKDPENGK